MAEVVVSPAVRATSSGSSEDEEALHDDDVDQHDQEAKSKSSLSTRASKVFTERIGSFLGVSEANSDSNNDLGTWREKFEQKVKSGSIGVQFSDISLVPNSKSRQELALTTDLQATLSRVSIASGHTKRQLEQLATVPDCQLTADVSGSGDEEDDETAQTPTVDALGFTEMAQMPRRGIGTTGSLPTFPLAANRSREYPSLSLSADHDVAAHKPSSITFSKPLEKNLTAQKRESLLRTLLLNKIGLKRRHSDPTLGGNFKPTQGFSSAKPLKSILKKHPSCPDVNEATSWISSEISTAVDESEEEVEDVFFRTEGLKQYLQFVQIEKENKKLALERKANKIEKDLLKRQQTILETMEIAKAFYAGESKPSGAGDLWRRVFGTLKGGRSSGRQGVNRARRDPAVRKQLEELSEHVPWFTYLFIVLQLLVLCSVLAAFGGITSVGLEPRLRFFEVLTFRGIETVEHWHARNIWVGPSQAFLIESGALFAPCMRDDHAINLEYSQSMWINMTSVDNLGCCEVASRNTAGTTTAWECANYTAGVGDWKEGVPCNARSHTDSNIAHVVKPCCHGNKVHCKMTTHEHCIFLEGNFFDDGPDHCSQVNCLSPLCKMGGVKSDPVHPYQARTPQQWWRLPVGLLHHQGVLHVFLDVVVQFLVGRQIEIIAGWIRIACIYVICGSMSLLYFAKSWAMMEGVVLRFYTRIFQWFGGDHAMISVVGSYVVMVSSFWLANALLLYMDVTGKPRWTQKYRVQKNQNTPIDRVKLKKALKTAVFNNILLNGLLTYPVYWTEKSWGCRFHPNELPTVSRFLLEMAVFGVIQETIFYYSHRLLHHPKLYRRVHKKHHEWTAPIGIVAIYATPAEYLTGNGLSVLMGPLVMGSHIMTIWVWFAIASIGTSIHHSGYHLPLLPSPEFHDFHHLTFNWNFGTLGWLDRLHNTDAEFRGTPQRKRHRTLLGLTPLSITYPDEDKKEQKDYKKRG